MINNERSKWLSRSLVLAGAAVSAGLAGWSWPTEPSLPGLALGSPVVLVMERTLLLFAGWLFLIVVASEAWQGRLPIEVSGRGVKYADAAVGQAVVERTEVALRRHDADIEALRREIADRGDRPSATERS